MTEDYDEETRAFYVNAPKPEVIFVPLDDEPERKICEYYTGNDRDVPPWWPIDPQPCCATCEEYEEYDNGVRLCLELGCHVRPKFYCSFWEMKK